MKFQKQTRKALRKVLPKSIVNNFDGRWVLYGIAAYAGLRYLNKRGIFTQTSAASDAIDRGTDTVKDTVKGTVKRQGTYPEQNLEQSLSH